MKKHVIPEFNSVSISGNMHKDPAHLIINFYNEDEKGNYFGKDFSVKLSMKMVYSLCTMMLHFIMDFERDDVGACDVYKKTIGVLRNCKRNKEEPNER